MTAHLSRPPWRDRVQPGAPLPGLARLAADPTRRCPGDRDRPAPGAASGRRDGGDRRQPARPRQAHRRTDRRGDGPSRTIAHDDRLREISIGSWDGLDRDEIAARAPGIFDGYDGSWYFRTPDGETYEEFAGRIGDSLAALAGRNAIVVTHGVVTRVLRGIYAGLPRAEAFRLPAPQDRFYRLADGRIDRGRGVSLRLGATSSSCISTKASS